MPAWRLVNNSKHIIRGTGRFVFLASVVLLLFALSMIATKAAPSSVEHWEVQGEMSEACTCQVPCTCNFGQGPSPHHYCWSLAAFHFDKGHYGAVKLDGLHLVRAHGNRSIVWYIDDRATAQQAAALRALTAQATHAAGQDKLHFEKARIVQTMSGTQFQLNIGDQGGFQANELIGMDGKNPIVVDNMTAWNVQHDIKGKTTRLHY